MEVLIPNAEVCAEFKGQRVYYRKDLSPIKSSIAWTRLGRSIKDGEIPVVQKEYIPRVKKLAGENGKAIHDLYAEWQTEEYKPPIAKNGIVPKNSYGNLDIFCERMVPIGCKHLPYQNIDKVAANLDIDYSQAVVRFKFHSGRATPITLGIVVCNENVDLVMSAYKEFLKVEVEKEQFAKKLEEQKALKIKKRLERLIDTFENETSKDSGMVQKKRKCKSAEINSFDCL